MNPNNLYSTLFDHHVTLVPVFGQRYKIEIGLKMIKQIEYGGGGSAQLHKQYKVL